MVTRIPSLLDYLKAHGAKGLAGKCGCNDQYLWQVARGHRRASPKLAKQIEKHSTITRFQLRPDIYEGAL